MEIQASVREVVYEKVLSALVLFYVLIITGTPSQNCHNLLQYLIGIDAPQLYVFYYRDPLV